MAELVDEVMYLTRQNQDWASCCESLLTYVTVLEQHVLLPAFGSVAKLLNEFHTVADARARGESALASKVNAVDHPQLARLFAQLRRPEPSTLHETERQELLSGPPPVDIDDAYVALLGFTRRQTRLLD